MKTKSMKEDRISTAPAVLSARGVRKLLVVGCIV
jgi:hypothetical protein